MSERFSVYEGQSISGNPEDIAKIEAVNTLRQYDVMMAELDKAIYNKQYRLRPSFLLALNRVALENLDMMAGTYRNNKISIENSRHTPPPYEEVPSLIESFCDYINFNLTEKTAIHLAAYGMWRLNWIHPFSDGNGRTSRAISYFILSWRSGEKFPSTKTIPEQISENKSDYYKALDIADENWRNGIVDVSAMEELLKKLLANQLLHSYKKAINYSGSSKIISSSKQLTDSLQEKNKTTIGQKNKGGFISWLEDHKVVGGLIGAGIVAIATVIAAILTSKH